MKPNANKLGWKIKKSQKKFSCFFWNVKQDKIQLPNKKIQTYNYIDSPGGVFVIPVTSDRKIILIKSYRYVTDSFVWEIPAGTLADRGKRSIARVARDELSEEVGGKAKKIVSLGAYDVWHGSTNRKAHYYLALGVQIDHQTAHEDGEVILQTQEIPLSKVRSFIRKKKIHDGESILGIFLALEYLKI